MVECTTMNATASKGVYRIHAGPDFGFIKKRTKQTGIQADQRRTPLYLPKNAVPMLPIDPTSPPWYLAAHTSQIGLITIAIGANDILACNPTDPPRVLNACLAAQLGQIGANLPVITNS